MIGMSDSTTPTVPLASLAKGMWWLVLIRGVLAIVFGIIALVAPGAALTAIAIVYGAYALVDGIATIAHAVRVRNIASRWGWLLVGGIAGVLAGLVALILPGLVGTFGGLVVLWTIVIWSIIAGVMGLRSAAGAPSGRGKTWGIVSGVVTVLLGVILAIALIVTPGATLLSLIWTVGAWAVIFGIVLVVTAFSVRAGAKVAGAAAS